ncbi:MAG: hypothetical protein QM784_30410 [Polyangiaceae bacterium]
MARLNLFDARGAVYVEFLIAFFPLFLLFLALCQLALVGAAEAVVRHSAYLAARSAIVVLEDDPEKFDGAARGSVSQGRRSRVRNIDQVLGKLGFDNGSTERNGGTSHAFMFEWLMSQHGARMVPIETAADLALLPLAPSERSVVASAGSIGDALGSASARQFEFAVQYTKATALVTLHDSETTEAPAHEPIAPSAPVTARVTYLFHCTVPVVRTLICGSLAAVAKRGFLGMTLAQQVKGAFLTDARFKVLSATATLPNQGAGYLTEEEE